MINVAHNALACQQFYAFLLPFQVNPVLFPGSEAPLQPNLETAQRAYSSELPPYEHQPDRTDKISTLPGIHNCRGHKLHLNVPAPHLREVSEYLKGHDYLHKYIGWNRDGKIFTMYIGAKDLAFQLATRLSSDLEPFLARPINFADVEYAPNIGGRFTSPPDEFSEAWGFLRGLTLHKSQLEDPSYVDDLLEKRRILFEGFDLSFAAAARLYGTFFYGSGELLTSGAISYFQF